MKRKKLSILLIVLCSNILAVSAQHSNVLLEGRVLQAATKTALAGVSIRWQGSNTAEFTDPDGYFKIFKNPENHLLIVQHLGFKTDSLMVHSHTPLRIYLHEASQQLGEIVVKASQSTTDRLSPIQNEIINIKSLKKAACCNLSESFETNATVSVSVADAITGIKQIQMLGLSGNYLQINQENMPNIRGLNNTYGISYIPGAWINSIDISKGIGSVTNGYESIIGSINVALVNPENPNKYQINGYTNSVGRAEQNLVYADTLNSRWGTVLLAHASAQLAKIDQNNDGFQDTPKYQQLNLLNKWKYQSEKIAIQFGAKYLADNKLGGQTQFDPDLHKGGYQYYGFGSNTNRTEVFAKFAVLFPHKPYQGLGLILSGSNHQNNSYFGQRIYSGRQKYGYANLLYQNIISNTNHTYKTGISFVYDNYHENFLDSAQHRTEIVPGAFVEYNYQIPNKLSLLVGLRYDTHNIYQNQFSPRLHLKYDLNSSTALRLAAGRGWRTPNALAENFGMLLNARNVLFKEKLLPELANNYGLSINKDFTLKNGKGSFVADYYYTNFSNQLVVDMEYHHATAFYNQVGRSYSKTYQAELNYSGYNRWEYKLAYRHSDVLNGLLAEDGSIKTAHKQFVNRQRILWNVAYATKWEKWKYDLTIQYNGPMRVPIFDHQIIGTKEYDWSPSYANINAQITKKFKKWEAYLGGENLGNFRQKNPIVDAANPFGPSFDASMIWGPVLGRIMYLGYRLNIEK
jgi:outer membrane receptor for ferrienterochelin and colicins